MGRENYTCKDCGTNVIYCTDDDATTCISCDIKRARRRRDREHERIKGRAMLTTLSVIRRHLECPTNGVESVMRLITGLEIGQRKKIERNGGKA